MKLDKTVVLSVAIICCTVIAILKGLLMALLAGILIAIVADSCFD